MLCWRISSMRCVAVSATLQFQTTPTVTLSAALRIPCFPGDLHAPAAERFRGRLQASSVGDNCHERFGALWTAREAEVEDGGQIL